jgi:hypothetical protein
MVILVWALIPQKRGHSHTPPHSPQTPKRAIPERYGSSSSSRKGGDSHYVRIKFRIGFPNQFSQFPCLYLLYIVCTLPKSAFSFYQKYTIMCTHCLGSHCVIHIGIHELTLRMLPRHVQASVAAFKETYPSQFVKLITDCHWLIVVVV